MRFWLKILILFFPLFAVAQSTQWKFTYEGFLEEAGQPASGAKAFRFQILGSAGAQSCLLYDETQSIQIDSGHFVAWIGTGVRKAGSDPGYTLKEVYGTPVNPTLLKDEAGTSCSAYDPASARRFLRVSVDGEKFADLELTRAPMATLAQDAETVGGKSASQLVQVNAAKRLTQANLESLFQVFASGENSSVKWNAATGFSAYDSSSGANFADGGIPWAKLGDVPDSLVKMENVTCAPGTVLKMGATEWTCASLPATMTVGTTSGTVAAGDDGRFGNAVKILGTPVATGSLVTNQILRYDGTSWVNSPETLSSLACVDGKILKRVNGDWACGDDASNAGTLTGLTSANPYLTAGTGPSPVLTLNVGTGPNTVATGDDTRFGSAARIGAVPITVTSPQPGEVLHYNGSAWVNATDADELSTLSCSDGKIVKRIAGHWACGDDSSNLGTVTSVSSTNAYVTVTNATTAPSITLNVGTGPNTVAAGDDSRFGDAKKLDGQNLAVSSASSGNFLKYNGTQWVSASDNDTLSGLVCGDGDVVKRSGGSWICATDMTTGGTISNDAGLLTTGTLDQNRLPVVPIAKGGTGASTAVGAFAALSPLAHHGELITHNGANPLVLAPGNDGEVLRSDSTSAAGLAWGPSIAKDLSSLVSTGIVQRTAAGSYSTVNVLSPLVYTTAAGLGVSVGTTGGTLAAGDDSRFGNTAKLQGVLIDGAAATPGNNQILKYNGSKWMLAADDTGGLPSGTATGDLGGSYPNPKVTGLQGQAIASTTAVSGQVLKYDASAWSPKYLGLADLKSAAGLAQMPGACVANQTLQWQSTNDTLSCVDIGSLDAAKITAGTIDPNRLPLIAVSKGGTGSNDGSISVSNTLKFTSTGTNANVELTPGSGGAVVATGGLRLAGSSSNSMTLRPPPGSANLSWTLPGDNGSSGNVLKTDGAGTLSWVSLAPLPVIPTGQVLANFTGSNALPTGTAPSALFDAVGGTTTGSMLYRSSSGWTSIGPGTAGTYLKSGGGAAPTWSSVDLSAGVGVVSIANGGTGTSTGSITTASPLVLNSTSTSGVSIVSSGAIALTPASFVQLNGSVGVGTSSPRAALDVANGAIVGRPSILASSTINFGGGNVQHTNASCGSFNLHNLKDGGSYIFIVKGTGSATCAFSVYSDAGSTALTIHYPPGYAATTASKQTLFNFLVSGGDVYLSWMAGYTP